MNRIIVQFVESHKFLLDTIYCQIANTEIYGIDINQNLYKSVFHIKPKYLLFSGYNLSPEIISFMQDNAVSSDLLTIYICWLDDDSYKHLDNKYKVTHIVPGDTNKIVKTENVIYYPNNLLNTNIFYSSNIENKNNNIIGFLEKITELSPELINCLYPNKKLPIKLFNNKNIHTIHNLGKVTEPQKAEILQQNKYYLNLDNNYSIAASVCGCTILNMSDIDNITDVQYKQPPAYKDHAQFLTEHMFK
jgi:hypothetical protein